jgi:hypothetical protein
LEHAIKNATAKKRDVNVLIISMVLDICKKTMIVPS